MKLNSSSSGSGSDVPQQKQISLDSSEQRSSVAQSPVSSSNKTRNFRLNKDSVARMHLLEIIRIYDLNVDVYTK